MQAGDANSSWALDLTHLHGITSLHMVDFLFLFLCLSFGIFLVLYALG